MGSLIEAKREKYRRYAEKIKLFNGLPPEYVRQIFHAGQSITYQQGAIITREGASCSAMLVVLKGQVSLYDHGVFLYKCVAGESFNELGVLLRDYKSPTAVADMETQVLGLEDHAARKLLDTKEGPVLLMNFIRVLGERTLSNSERIVRVHHALKEHDPAASDRIAQQVFDAKAKTAPI